MVGVGVGVEEEVEVGVLPPSANFLPRATGLGTGEPCWELSGQHSPSFSNDLSFSREGFL